MYIADALSRAYLPETNESLVPKLEVNEVNLTAHLPISPDKYVEFKKATAEDQVMQLLQDTVFDGWPNTKAELPVDIRPYWTYRDEVSCVDGLLFKGNKLVVPHALRAQMLDKIHESHQGIVKCKQRARDILFWPSMSAQIEDRVAKCDTCSQYQRAHAKEPTVLRNTRQTMGQSWSRSL